MAGNARGKRGRLGLPATIRRRVPKYDKDGKRQGYDNVTQKIYITAPSNVWDFLGLQGTAAKAGGSPVYGNSIPDHTRDSGMVGIEKGEDIAVQGYDGRLKNIQSKGTGRSVRLITGVPVRAGSTRFRTITFNFPSWCSNANIAEGLGELIADTKRKAQPGLNEVRPFFITEAGTRYPIMSNVVAKTDVNVDVATDDAAIQELSDKTKPKPKTGGGEAEG